MLVLFYVMSQIDTQIANFSLNKSTNPVYISQKKIAGVKSDILKSGSHLLLIPAVIRNAFP